ncbi:Dual specificity protein phosphatase 22 [Tupaia chinensis]|uniref:JNK pathway associated phosphatase n=1 Tax=Tupaia chinensis TaxID=246437 RepID=L9L5U1_TUPCH|nr:Dual specificity protein phosphatase 22 [Tupaia chinensis]
MGNGMNKGVKYLCIPAADSPSQNLTRHFKESIKFIHECRLRGEGCLVHCLAGVSRSVTLVIAYIMTVTDFGWEDALHTVRAGRSCANPNLGFQRQLQEFEKHEVHQYRQWLKEEYGESPLRDAEEAQNILVPPYPAACALVPCGLSSPAQPPQPPIPGCPHPRPPEFPMPSRLSYKHLRACIPIPGPLHPHAGPTKHPCLADQTPLPGSLISPGQANRALYALPTGLCMPSPLGPLNLAPMLPRPSQQVSPFQAAHVPRART